MTTMIRTTLVLLCVVAPLTASAQFDLLTIYQDELARLVDTPGTSRSVAAGRLNPASWRIQDQGGFYLGVEDPQQLTGVDDIIGVLSLRNLAFGFRHYAVADVPIAGGFIQDLSRTEYTIGLSFGNRSVTSGLSYTWDRGDRNILGDSRRFASGSIYRNRWGSLGLSSVYDVDLSESLNQADIGLRPFGPRFTLFADFIGWYADGGDIISFDWDETEFGYGAEVQPIAGVRAGFRIDDRGDWSWRVGLGLDGFQPSMRYRANNDGDHLSSTYAVEFAPSPDLRDGIPMLYRSKGVYPEINLKGEVTYRNFGWFDDRTRFLRLLATVDAYAQSPRVDGVVVKTSGMRMSLANMWELRTQLAGLRAQGKKVLVAADRLDLAQLMLASVADEVWMDPQGGIDMRGLVFGRSYYASMLEKIGIGFEEWRFFDYKSALESFARDDLSEGAREQLQTILDSFWKDLLTPIANARGLSVADLEEFVDTKGRLTPEEAEDAGLIDIVGDLHELRKNRDQAQRRPGGDDDVALLGVTFGDRVWRDEEWGEPKKIAVAYAIGPCAMDSGIRGPALAQWIRSMREDSSVAAIVLRADSPGGDPLPSDLVARELRATRGVKPIIVSQGQVAGSGGYWISMDGDQIVASPFTITGSIGVISGHVYDDGIGERVGVSYDFVKKGESADLFRGPSAPLVPVSISHRPATDEERARVRETIMMLYDDFVDAVAAGRDMSTDDVREIAQGRIWSGTDGKEIGLVDEIAGLWAAITIAKQEAGLDADDRVQIVEGPDLGLFPPNLFSPRLIGAKIAAAFRGDDTPTPLDPTFDPQSVSVPALLENVVSPSEWNGMSLPARIYLLELLSAPTQPKVMMQPWEISVGGR